jgi:hypothetical protein
MTILRDGAHVGDFYAGYGDSDLNKTQAGFDLTGFREAHAPIDVAIVGAPGRRGLFSASEATIGLVALLVIVWYFGRSIG